MADISTDYTTWSTTAGNNNPSASTNIGTGLDDNLRALQAGVAQLYIDVPGLPLGQQSKSADYTLVLGDANKHVLHPTADNNPRVFTIPANSSVAFSVGTMITFVNQINTVTVAITTDTLTQAGTGSTGSRTLAANGIATALKVSSTGWVINGSGLS